MSQLSSLLPKNFKASSYTPAEPTEPRKYTVLPAGTYNVEIMNAEVRPLRSGRGTGLNIEFSVIDPMQHAGRKLWHNINIKHDNEVAQRIGMEQLVSLCAATGIDEPNEDALFQKVLKVKVAIAPAQNGYPEKNEVMAFLKAGAGIEPPKSIRKPTAPALESMPSDLDY